MFAVTIQFESAEDARWFSSMAQESTTKGHRLDMLGGGILQDALARGKSVTVAVDLEGTHD